MISTKAEDCALCGSPAVTFYRGDDFCLNIKRATCSNRECSERSLIRDVNTWNVRQKALKSCPVSEKRLK